MTKVLLKSNALSTLWIQICDSCEEFFDPENCLFLESYIVSWLMILGFKTLLITDRLSFLSSRQPRTLLVDLGLSLCNSLLPFHAPLSNPSPPSSLSVYPSLV